MGGIFETAGILSSVTLYTIAVTHLIAQGLKLADENLKKTHLADHCRKLLKNWIADDKNCFIVEKLMIRSL